MHEEAQRRVNKLQWLAERAKADKEMRFENLIYLIDERALHEAYRRTRKGGASGIDGQTGAQYGEHLDENIRDLITRLKQGRYRAPAVRRAWIPKENGEKRPLGVPTFEDKVLQRAVVALLDVIYEQDFKECSYGFRPGRSAHDALRALREQCYRNRVSWVVDVDIKGFFDSIDHGVVRELLQRRIADRSIQRLVGKWLNAGVLEGGELIHPETGTPQGGVISPLLANICLNYILDEWFIAEVQPRLKGRSFLIRYCDDFVIGCEYEQDARRVMTVLPKRMNKYGLKLNEGKTRLVPFERPVGGSKGRGTFNFLGFTHYWGKTRNGYWVIKRKTARRRLQRTLKRIAEWCKTHRHRPLAAQARVLSQKLRGHYQYFGIYCNARSLKTVYYWTVRTWRYWLNRRDNTRRMSWERFTTIVLRCFPLPVPRVVHSWM